MNDTYTYFWHILSITKKSFAGKSDVICKIVWKMIGIDPNDVTGEFKTSIELPLPDSFDENFIDYNSLTQNNLVDWITQIVDIEDVYNYINSEIEKNKDEPTIVLNGNYPWQQQVNEV
jgi:uncharacterized UPF0160 family protein